MEAMSRQLTKFNRGSIPPVRSERVMRSRFMIRASGSGLVHRVMREKMCIIQRFAFNRWPFITCLLALVFFGSMGCGSKPQPAGSKVSTAEIVQFMAGKWASDRPAFEECEFLIENPTINELNVEMIGRVVGKGGRTLDWGGSPMWFKKFADGSLEPRGSAINLYLNDSGPTGELWNQRHGGVWNIISLNGGHMVLESSKSKGDFWNFSR